MILMPNFPYLCNKAIIFSPPEIKLEGALPIQQPIFLPAAIYKLSQHEIVFLQWFISNQRFRAH